MRHAARVDKNQAEIVAALRAAGAKVWIIGLPVDLCVGHAGQTALMELKSTTKSPKTKLQQEFFASWTGGTLCYVNDVEGALRVLATMKS